MAEGPWEAGTGWRQKLANRPTAEGEWEEGTGWRPHVESAPPALINPPWEAGVGPRLAVQMAMTSWRTFIPNLVGAANAAIRVVTAAPYAQRVVVKHETQGSLVFIGDAMAELELPGLVTPRNAFTLGPSEVHVMVVAPGQALYAARNAVATRLSVSASQVVPIPTDRCHPLFGRIKDSTFQTHTLGVAGTPNAATRIVTASQKPQRFIVRHTGGVGSLVFIASSVPELENGAAAGPIGFAYELGENLPHTFVAAPGQLVLAAANGPGITLAVSVSEVSLQQREGPTGLPGPDGAE